MAVDQYVRDFYMIFQFNETQKFVAEHYEIDFDMIFHFMAPKNMHYEKDIDMIFHLKVMSTFGCTAL